MNKYPVFKWHVRSYWASGGTSVESVYVPLPNFELAKQYIQNYVKNFLPVSDVRLHVGVEFVWVISPDEVLPVAYRANDETLWDEKDVLPMYPVIESYWRSLGFTDLKIVPCGPVDEDCLYICGKWYSYCRFPHEWMQREDIVDWLAPPKAKQRRRNCTI